MSTLFNLLRPQLAPSLLQHLLTQKQAALSAEAGAPVLLNITVGYDGLYFVTKLHNFEDDDGWSEGRDLDAAIAQAAQMLTGMQEARQMYMAEVSAES